MSFFNKKEEVIDIQLTRFGKHSLAKGNFKPVYYQFFDDDIIYNQPNPNDTFEAQNKVEDRILKETPRNKSNLNMPINRLEFLKEDFSIHNQAPPGQAYSNNKFYSLEEQDRILLYPLSSYESNSRESAFFELKSYGENLKKIDSSGNKEIKFLHHTSSGIYKKIPQLKINNLYEITRTPGIVSTSEELRRLNNSNNFIDLTSERVEFLDKSVVKVLGNKILLSLEEGNSYYNLANFELEIYEITEFEKNEDEKFLKGDGLKRLKNIDDINKLFIIKTDEDVVEVETTFGRLNNWYRTGEQ
tara:strand:- start:61 stop:963 length:903 start_codon:yes stop_codon:yes gene_type:complete